MNMGGMGCQRRVAGNNGVDNQQVLGGCGTKPQRVSAGQPTDACQMGANGAQGADKKGIFDGRIEGVFEFVDEHVVAAHTDIALVQKLRSSHKGIAECQKRCRIAAGGSQTYGLHLKGLAQFVQFGDTVNGNVGHLEATTAASYDQTVGDQSSYRFAQRSAGYANTLCLFDFEQGRSGGEEATDNLSAQLTVRPLAGSQRCV